MFGGIIICNCKLPDITQTNPPGSSDLKHTEKNIFREAKIKMVTTI